MRPQCNTLVHMKFVGADMPSHHASPSKALCRGFSTSMLFIMYMYNRIKIHAHVLYIRTC